MNTELQWCYIKNTHGIYILLSDGRVFSGKSENYLTPQEKAFCYYYYRILFEGDKKPRNISVYKLLSEYFPKSLEHKEYYQNVERMNEIYGRE